VEAARKGGKAKPPERARKPVRATRRTRKVG